jgi:hypothetical protein
LLLRFFRVELGRKAQVWSVWTFNEVMEVSRIESFLPELLNLHQKTQVYILKNTVVTSNERYRLNKLNLFPFEMLVYQNRPAVHVVDIIPPQ